MPNANEDEGSGRKSAPLFSHGDSGYMCAGIGM